MRSPLLLIIALLFSLLGLAGCQKPEIKSWYTTSAALPDANTAVGGTHPVTDDGKERIWLIVAVEISPTQLWAPIDKSTAGAKYSWQPDDFQLLTSDGQKTAARLSRNHLGNFSSKPEQSDYQSHTTAWLAFDIEEAAIDQGDLQLYHRDRLVMTLPKDKQTSEPPAGD